MILIKYKNKTKNEISLNQYKKKNENKSVIDTFCKSINALEQVVFNQS